MAEKGDNDALYLLGIHYGYGIGINKDRKKALEIFDKLAKIENQITNYLSGDKEITINKANNWYSRMLRYSKQVNAKLVLGVFYKLGYGTELGNCYLNGIGTEVNKMKAFESYEKAANQGYKVAQYILGECYELGNGVNRDETKEAFEYYKKYYKKSTENEFKEVDLKYGCHCLISKRSEINREKEFELYIDAHNSNFGNIINDLEFLKVSEMHDGST
ncbi:unnamed protein product [Rhizophagus irregularis]|nr:unnamed protein product [Rhizophagus irregularis]